MKHLPHTTFNELVYGELSTVNDILNTLSEVNKRLKPINWTITKLKIWKSHVYFKKYIKTVSLQSFQKKFRGSIYTLLIIWFKLSVCQY